MTHRYTLTEALAVVVDQIDGEDPNTDAYAGLLDPLRQLLEDLILQAECDCETGLCERCASEFVEMAEPTALTNDGLAAILGAHLDRLVVFNPATKSLDGCVSVSINGGAVQLTVEEEPKSSGDLMVGRFNATQAARDLIQEAAQPMRERANRGGELMHDAIFDALEDNLSMMASLVADRFPAWKGVLDENGEFDTLEVIRLYLEQEDEPDLAGPGDLSPEIGAEPGAAFSYGFLLALGQAHDLSHRALIGELQAETKRRATR